MSGYNRWIRLAGGWSGRVFLEIKGYGAGSALSRHTFGVGDWKRCLREPEALRAGERIYKKQGSAQVVGKDLRVGSTVIQVIVKSYPLRRGWKGLLEGVRRSRALRQWHRACLLVSRQLPTAFPLVVLERRKFFLLRESILLTEEIPNSYNLHRALKRGEIGSYTTRQRRELAERVGALLGKLYARGFRHRDCKASNLIIERGLKVKGGIRVWLIDLDGLRLGRWYRYTRRQGHFRRHQALIRLGVSLWESKDLRLTDYTRCLRAYLREGGFEEAGGRQLRHQLHRQLREDIQRAVWEKKNAH